MLLFACHLSSLSATNYINILKCMGPLPASQLYSMYL